MSLKLLTPVAALLCSACAFHSQVDRATVDYNQAVANSTNELTLLNVVRAMHRYPLHFTSIAKISGTFKVTGRAGLNVDLNEGGGSSKFSPAGALLERATSIGAEKFGPSAGAEVSAGPSFDIGVLDTQEFYQGILASVGPDLIGNFLNLGWPDDLVAAMLIERIEFHVQRATEASDTAGKRKLIRTQARAGGLASRLEPPPYGGREAVWVLNNDPQSRDFEQFLRCFHLKPASKNVDPVDLLPTEKLELKLADLLLLDGEKLALSAAADPGKRIVQRVKPPARGLTIREVARRNGGPSEVQCAFTLEPQDKGHEPHKLSIDIYHPDGRAERQTAFADAEHGNTSDLVVQLTGPGKQEPGPNEEREEVTASVHIVLRSAQAVLYYLGEYARAAEPYRLRGGERVITVRPGGGDAFLTARLNGKAYAIPADPSEHGRSPTAIDLAQQLVNLNKSAKDKPVTQSLRIID